MKKFLFRGGKKENDKSSPSAENSKVKESPLFSRRPLKKGPTNNHIHNGNNNTNNNNVKTADPGTLSEDGSASIFRVIVPEGIQEGQEFQVYAGQRIVRVRCPSGCLPGQSLQITVPIDTLKNGGTPPADSSNVTKLPDDGGPPAYMVRVPAGVAEEEQFTVTIQGQQLMVTCPTGASPGDQVRIIPPLPPPTSPLTLHESLGQSSATSRGSSTAGAAAGTNSNGEVLSDSLTLAVSSSQQSVNKPPKEETQLFEVQVPQGVLPGQPFALLAGGVRVLVTCPTNAGPGQRIRFKLPLALTQKPEAQSEAAQIKLSYDKDGWTRTIRVSDMRFVWVRMDIKGDIDSNTRFDAEKSAYVRKLDFRPGSDFRLRDGHLSLVPATEAYVNSWIKNSNDEDLVTYADIANAQVKTFAEKVEWFHSKCRLLAVAYSQGYMRINVRREFLLQDSVDAIMMLSRRDLRKTWRFEFIGERGVDAGGLAREWFQLVTEKTFDPDMGLWQSSNANQMCMQINPASKFVHDDYLVYYRFLGRVMGKALFEQHLVAGHMVQYIYKHMLGWPIMFRDLEMIDEEYYCNLKQLKELANAGEDLEMLSLDFTTRQEIMGANEEIELIEGGMDTAVTNDNFPEYMEACLKHRMLDQVKPQLNELLLGFFDVIPEPLLTVFDFQELELLMCGLPKIDLEDWQANTEYTGEVELERDLHPAVQWFWEVVKTFDEEMKARLLQFVTGTSGVPARGFGVLQGSDNQIRRFTIHGVNKDTCLYPRAHTCFNRIDLPTYHSKEELRDRLKLAVTMVATGFDLE